MLFRVEITFSQIRPHPCLVSEVLATDLFRLGQSSVGRLCGN